MILAVFDLSRPIDDDDKRLIGSIFECGKEKQTVCIYNKADLSSDTSCHKLPFEKTVTVSALNNEGLEELVETVSLMFGAGEIGENDEIVVNARQCASVINASCSVGNAIDALETFTQDIAGMDIENALSAIAEADGRTVSEDIVNEIFSHFCVGK